LAARTPPTIRTQRAGYLAAAERANNPATAAIGWQELNEFVVKHPDAPLAPKALMLVRDHLLATLSCSEAQTQMAQIQTELDDRQLASEAAYQATEIAKRCEDPDLERQLLLAFADRYRFPDAPRWDDVILRLAELEESSDPRKAEAHLKSLIARYESALIAG